MAKDKKRNRASFRKSWKKQRQQKLDQWKRDQDQLDRQQKFESVRIFDNSRLPRDSANMLSEVVKDNRNALMCALFPSIQSDTSRDVVRTPTRNVNRKSCRRSISIDRTESDDEDLPKQPNKRRVTECIDLSIAESDDEETNTSRKASSSEGTSSSKEASSVNLPKRPRKAGFFNLVSSDEETSSDEKEDEGPELIIGDTKTSFEAVDAKRKAAQKAGEIMNID